MDFNFTDRQVHILLRLVRTEMDGFCGDVGYEELSKLHSILEQKLENEVSDK